MLRLEMCRSERKDLQTSNLVYRWSTKTRIGDRHDGSPARSTVKFAMSRDASDRCWPISLERKVTETSKLVSRLRMQ